MTKGAVAALAAPIRGAQVLATRLGSSKRTTTARPRPTALSSKIRSGSQLELSWVARRAPYRDNLSHEIRRGVVTALVAGRSSDARRPGDPDLTEGIVARLRSAIDAIASSSLSFASLGTRNVAQAIAPSEAA